MQVWMTSLNMNMARWYTIDVHPEDGQKIFVPCAIGPFLLGHVFPIEFVDSENGNVFNPVSSYWGQDKMADTFQTTFSNVFCFTENVWI